LLTSLNLNKENLTNLIINQNNFIMKGKLLKVFTLVALVCFTLGVNAQVSQKFKAERASTQKSCVELTQKMDIKQQKAALLDNYVKPNVIARPSISDNAKAALSEGFEGTFLPDGWANNGAADWDQSDQDTAYSGAYYARYNCYSINGLQGELETPVLMPTAGDLTFTYWLKYYLVSGAYGELSELYVDIYDVDADTAWIESTDELIIGNHGLPWWQETIDLSSYLTFDFTDKLVKLRFRAISDWGSYNIAIDDVAGPEVYVPPVPDLKMLSIDAPVTDFGLGTESIDVTFTNVGGGDIVPDSLGLSYILDGAPAVDEAYTGATVAPGDTVTVTFATQGDFSAYINHDLRVYSTLNEDIDPLTDTIDVVIGNADVTDLSGGDFTEDFQTGGSDYTLLMDDGDNSLAFVDTLDVGTEFALYLTGNNNTAGWPGGSSTSTTSAEAFSVYTDYHATSTLRVDATTQSTGFLQLKFDLKQMHEFGFAYEWFFVLVDGDTIADVNGDYHWNAATASADPFAEMEFDLSAYEGTTFDLTFLNVGKYETCGAIIDNLFIGLPPANDVGVTSIDVPVGIISEAVYPEVTVRNFGSAQQTFDVTVDIDDAGYTSTFNVVDLAAGASTNVTFTDLYTPSGFGDYNTTTYTQLAGDVVPENDTATLPFSVAASVGDTVRYDNGTNVNGIGYGAAGEYGAYIHLPIDSVVNYAGQQILRLRMFINGATDVDSTKIEIYTDTANHLAPDYSQWFTHVEGWNEVVLDVPYDITGTEALTVGYYLYANGGYPMGVGPGPAHPFGDWLFDTGDDVWYNIGPDFGLDYNWNLAALISSPPVLQAIENYPAAGAISQAIDVEVFSVFNLPITEVDLSGVTITPDPGSVVASIVNDTLMIAHDDFAFETEYTVLIPAGAVTNGSDILTYDVEWSFTTLAAGQPLPVEFMPAAGASDIVTDADVWVTLDVAVDSLDLTGVIITPDPGGVYAWLDEDSIIVIDHDDFDGGTLYTVTIPADAVQGTVSGVNNEAIVWNFTIMDTYNAIFHVTNDATGGDVGGATIDVTGYGSLTTDFGGMATFTNIMPESAIAYTVTFTGQYLPFSNDFDVVDQDVSVDVALTPVGINELSKAGISIHPNPSSGLFYVDVNGEYEVKVMNLTGEIVYTTIVNDKGTINLTEQPAGLYIIQLTTENQVVNHRIMVK